MGSSASASLSSPSPSAATLHRSLWLGALGVLMFAMTLPMTRLAVGPADAPQLPPLFVTAGRAAGAGLLADGWLLLAVLGASVAYVSGARLSAGWQAEQVISWVLVLSLPVTLPVAALSWPQHAVSAGAWGGFAYVTVFSIWVGFFAWYRALAMGGTLRVSQVQLLQPFLALLLAVPVLGEALSPHTLGFALAVLAVVVVGKRMPLAARQPSTG